MGHKALFYRIVYFSTMIYNDLSGTWKGETIVPGHLRTQGTDKVDEFFLRIKQDYERLTFTGIFMGNPESSGNPEHGSVVGEVVDGPKVYFETRFSKFYFYLDHHEQEVATSDKDINSKIKYSGNLIKQDMLIGEWEFEQTMFEFQGMVRKTQPWYGKWWQKKCLGN